MHCAGQYLPNKFESGGEPQSDNPAQDDETQSPEFDGYCGLCGGVPDWDLFCTTEKRVYIEVVSRLYPESAT
eukprot:4970347-Amphidinium_carterae.1